MTFAFQKNVGCLSQIANMRMFVTQTYVITRAVATFEATEAAASVVFRTVASVKAIII